ncbi:hypothetical protein NDU88_002992 [Pleurodeles waltl]|uniref:Uncharacterized protein n=1 Tax=Pleurodeles waltl TaxID=8319 RepID=A0AAV7MTA2_PLEWA|nr:hypothetical protein NDU88_002992 [Pleurodeles waltl]
MCVLCVCPLVRAVNRFKSDTLDTVTHPDTPGVIVTYYQLAGVTSLAIRPNGALLPIRDITEGGIEEDEASHPGRSRRSAVARGQAEEWWVREKSRVDERDRGWTAADA